MSRNLGPRINYTLRIPKHLAKHLAKCADEEKVSMNTFILKQLDQQKGDDSEI
jgi:predicted HicB family RNase H-like nuclease